MAAFTANSRVPTRPLSYAYKDMAMPKELLIDYNNGLIYVVDEQGNIHDVSQQVYERLVASGEITTPDTEMDIPDPDNPGEFITVTLEEALTQVIADIDTVSDNVAAMQTTITEIQNANIQQDTKINDNATAISNLKTANTQQDSKINQNTADIASIKTTNTNQDASIKANADAIAALQSKVVALKLSELSGNLSADRVDPTTNRQFVSTAQLNNIKEKVSIDEQTVTIVAADVIGDKAPYTVTISVTGIDPSLPSPIVDIVYSNPSNLEDCEKEEDSFYQLYRCSITVANKATLYFREKPENNFKIKFQIYTPGID